MRVALVTDGIWPYVLGGMQKHSYYLCKYLAQNKVQVDLFHFNSSHYNIDLLEFFTPEENKFIRSVIVYFPMQSGFPGAYMLNSYNHSKLIFEKIKEHLPNYDFIYTKGFTGWYLLNQKQHGKIKCAPIGVKFHGYEMFQKAPDFKIWLQQVLLLRYPVKSLSRKADVVFSYGGKVTDIIKSLGVKLERIVELPSGVEESSLGKSIEATQSILKFVYLGRYERRKGVEELNVAIQDLLMHSKSSRAEFHFIGPIPEDKKIQHPHVIYHGEVREKAEMQRLLVNCDVLLCPSWSEGLPNVILEAMGMGLAVMASDVGAINVLVNKQTGWLISKCDVALIKQSLVDILTETPESIDIKKQNALNRMREEFTWEKLIKTLYEKLRLNH